MGVATRTQEQLACTSFYSLVLDTVVLRKIAEESIFKSQSTSKLKETVKIVNALKIFWPFKVYIHNRVLLSLENITVQNRKGPQTSAAATGNYHIT